MAGTGRVCVYLARPGSVQQPVAVDEQGDLDESGELRSLQQDVPTAADDSRGSPPSSSRPTAGIQRSASRPTARRAPRRERAVADERATDVHVDLRPQRRATLPTGSTTSTDATEPLEPAVAVVQLGRPVVRSPVRATTSTRLPEANDGRRAKERGAERWEVTRCRSAMTAPRPRSFCSFSVIVVVAGRPLSHFLSHQFTPPLLFAFLTIGLPLAPHT